MEGEGKGEGEREREGEGVLGRGIFVYLCVVSIYLLVLTLYCVYTLIHYAACVALVSVRQRGEVSF